MHALILSDIPMIQYHTRLALLQRGFMVMAAETNATAGEHVRRWRFDLLIAQERVGGKLTHGVLLSAEKRAHYVKTVLLSDKEGEARDELYDLLPSVASIMPSSTSPDLLAQVGTAAVTGAARALRRRRLPKTTAPLLLLPAHRTDVARPVIQSDEFILQPTG